MRVLVDTHVILWLDASPERLGGQLALLEDESTDLLISAVSSWEIVIKFASGRLSLPARPTAYLPDLMTRFSATPVAVEHAHALGVADLPPHHKDPFDRLLVAQAVSLSIPIMTADRVFRQYDVELLQV